MVCDGALNGPTNCSKSPLMLCWAQAQAVWIVQVLAVADVC
jgi:hypothetical protein